MLTMLGSWRRFLTLALVGVLTASLGAVMTRSAEAANSSSPTGNSPTSIEIVEITSKLVAPSGLPGGAEPYVIVQQGDTFSVEVRFLDSRGKSTFFDAPTTLTMTAVSNAGFDVGDEVGVDVFNSDGSAVAVDVAKGQRTAVLTVKIAAAVNRVRLTVSATVGSPAVVVTGDSADDRLFDVLSDVKDITIGPQEALQTGIGGSDGSCASATAEAPVCGTLLLPNGAASENVFMSLGACDRTVYTNCGTRLGGSIVQVLADLTAPNPANPKREIDLYTKTSPATLIIRCDRTLCETGAIQSIPVNYSLSGDGALGNADPCPRKETLGQNQEVCVDYVQSKRDGASDTILYLLFTRDLRGGIG